MDGGGHLAGDVQRGRDKRKGMAAGGWMDLARRGSRFARAIKRFVEKGLARIASNPKGWRGDISFGRGAALAPRRWEDFQ
jgi:hypothetical protein